jgi:hypothetical protein
MRWKSPPAAPAECLPANHGEPELAWESGGAGGGLQLEGRKSVEDALFALLFAQHPAGAHQLGKFGKQMSAIDDVSAAHLVSFERRRQAQRLPPAKTEDPLDRCAVEDGCRERFDRTANLGGAGVPGGSKKTLE